MVIWGSDSPGCLYIGVGIPWEAREGEIWGGKAGGGGVGGGGRAGEGREFQLTSV